MAFSCSLQTKFAISTPLGSFKPKLLGLNKYNSNVLSNFVFRGSHLASQSTSTFRFAAKCLKVDVTHKQRHVDGTTGPEVVIIDGLRPAVLTPPQDLSRDDFPSDFKFGASTSALQTEGSGTEGGRGESTWDFMIEGSKGMKGADSYNLYKEDIKLLKAMGMNSYRFSISWSRILPKGTEEDGGINQEGINFYKDFINELVKNEITPVVTLFHFDLPVNLQKKYNGFLDSQIVEDFTKYAKICFENFGYAIKHWSTINEPYVFGSAGYKIGLPADVSKDPMGPYIATHNIILAHASAADLYHREYQKDHGKIGISLPCKWFEPYTIHPKDVDASMKHLDFMLGWYMDPFTKGEYPESMKESIRGLPEFIPEQKKMLQESCDFIGINYYTARFSKHKSVVDSQTGLITTEYHEDTKDTNGDLIGEQAIGQDGIYVYPDGLRNLLLYLKEKYNNPEIYVTENGVPSKPKITRSVKDSIKDENFSELEDAFFDDYRISFAEQHLIAVREAMKGGANVKGYFFWTLIDNMEVGQGYDTRFGLNYVDYCDNYKRYPKKSAFWFAQFLKKDAPMAKKLGHEQELERGQEN